MCVRKITLHILAISYNNCNDLYHVIIRNKNIPFRWLILEVTKFMFLSLISSYIAVDLTFTH